MKSIFNVIYNFRYESIDVLLFAEDELDAKQKADYRVFVENKGKFDQRTLKDVDCFEVEPDEEGFIDMIHSEFYP